MIFFGPKIMSLISDANDPTAATMDPPGEPTLSATDATAPPEDVPIEKKEPSQNVKINAVMAKDVQKAYLLLTCSGLALRPSK